MTAGRVLVVDDDASLRQLFRKILTGAGFECLLASNADEARSKVSEVGPELVLADINMPGGSGLDLVRDIHETSADVATIMVTGIDDPQMAEEALRIGAYGYLIKPVSRSELLINVRNAMLRRALEIDNRRHQDLLSQRVEERTTELWNAIQGLERTQEELRLSREQTITRLSIAGEFRDRETARHIQRMSRYCGLLAKEAGASVQRADLIRVGSVMHDVGKIGVPDRVLLKPGRLTREEHEVMKTHAAIGHEILAGTGSDLLDLAATMALSHHENVDGSGYPRGLTGEEIPWEGRVCAIADVFDALITDRVYRRAYGLQEALDVIREGRGTKFDDELVEVFLDNLHAVFRINEEEEENAPKARPAPRRRRSRASNR